MIDQYEIIVEGHVDDVCVDWFVRLTKTYAESGETILRGELVDQAALHELLTRVRDRA